jgi:hypothetical protein
MSHLFNEITHFMKYIHSVRFKFFYTLWTIFQIFHEVDKNNFIHIVKYLIIKINYLRLICAHLYFYYSFVHKKKFQYIRKFNY